MEFFEGALISGVDRAVSIDTNQTDKICFKPRLLHGFVFYLGGTCHYLYPEHLSFTASRDMFLYLPKGVAYEIRPPEDSTCMLIDFDTANATDFSAFGQLLHNAPRIRDCFISALHCYRQKRSGCMAELISLLYRIVSLVQAAQRTTYLPRAASDKLEPALNGIAERYQDPLLRVSELAELCQMSERYFSGIFFRCCGVSPKQYILNMRIEQARSMLSSGTLPIGRIAEQCGFPNAYYFSRKFRETVGMTPSEYRRMSIY